MPQVQAHSERYNYGQYLDWPDEPRYELIDGVAYAMSPAPTRTHQRFIVELLRQIADALEDSPCEVNIAPFDVRLPENDEADDEITTVVQPDILVVCDPDKLDDRGCKGAPDWVIEVISAGSAAHDRIRKLALYEHHRVREYWIVHPIDRILSIYELQDGEYRRPAEFELTGTTQAFSLPVSIAWERVLSNIDG